VKYEVLTYFGSEGKLAVSSFSAFSDFLRDWLINVKLSKVYTSKSLYNIIYIPLNGGCE